MTLARSSPSHALRSLGIVAAAAIVIISVSASVQLLAGAYEMGWTGALAALGDPDVWRHPEVLVRLVGGDLLADRFGLSAASPLSTSTLIVWTVRLPRRPPAG